MDLNEEQHTTEKIQKIILETLQTLRKNEGYVSVDIDDMSIYNSLKGLVAEGYIDKSSLTYKITEKGLDLLESIESYIEKARIDLTENTVIDLKEKALFEEAYFKRDLIKVSYMRPSLTEENVIENAVAEFEKDVNDGLPIIPVSEDAYKGLIDRQPGQHWRRYLGEAGRKLIRDKKLSKVYVVNEDTGRKYLYFVPKK